MATRRASHKEDHEIFKQRSAYQVMPPMGPEEYAALKASILQRGLQDPIKFDEDDNILDGHHRYQAWLELRHEGADPGVFRRETVEGLDSHQDKRDYARELNSVRRTLSTEQRRELIRAQLKETPQRADSWVAETLGFGEHSVRRMRLLMEGAGELPRFEHLIRRDGRRTPHRGAKPSEVYPELTPFPPDDQRRLRKSLDNIHDPEERAQTLDAIRRFDSETLSSLLGREFSLPNLSVREATNGHVGALWHRALSDLYQQMASVNRSEGFLPLIRRWSSEEKTYYLAEVKRLRGVLSSWEEILEQEVAEDA